MLVPRNLLLSCNSQSLNQLIVWHVPSQIGWVNNFTSETVGHSNNHNNKILYAITELHAFHRLGTGNDRLWQRCNINCKITATVADPMGYPFQTEWLWVQSARWVSSYTRPRELQTYMACSDSRVQRQHCRTSIPQAMTTAGHATQHTPRDTPGQS